MGKKLTKVIVFFSKQICLRARSKAHAYINACIDGGAQSQIFTANIKAPNIFFNVTVCLIRFQWKQKHFRTRWRHCWGLAISKSCFATILYFLWTKSGGNVYFGEDWHGAWAEAVENSQYITKVRERRSWIRFLRSYSHSTYCKDCYQQIN